MQVGRDIIFLLHMALREFCGHTMLASGVLGVKRMLRNYLRLKKILCTSRAQSVWLIKKKAGR